MVGKFSVGQTDGRKMFDGKFSDGKVSDGRTDGKFSDRRTDARSKRKNIKETKQKKNANARPSQFGGMMAFCKLVRTKRVAPAANKFKRY